MSSIVKFILIFFLVVFLPIKASFSDTAPPENCAVRPFDQGRLWQIKKANTPPSYVFGTMHSKDPRILYLPGVIMQAFNSSASLILETSLKAEKLANSRAMMFGSGSFSLKKKIGNSRFRRLEKMAEPYGLTAQTLNKLKIWAAAAVLSQPPQPRSPKDQSLTLLDRELEKSAHRMEKTVVPLESMKEQLSLFDRMERSLQIEYLDQAMNEHSELETEIDRLSNHYLAGQTGWIFCDLEETLQTVSRALASFMTDQLINDRNRTMVSRMLPHLEKGSAFVAIGALHLPGEKGILSLLERQGFKIHRKF